MFSVGCIFNFSSVGRHSTALFSCKTLRPKIRICRQRRTWCQSTSSSKMTPVINWIKQRGPVMIRVAHHLCPNRTPKSAAWQRWHRKIIASCTTESLDRFIFFQLGDSFTPAYSSSLSGTRRKLDFRYAGLFIVQKALLLPTGSKWDPSVQSCALTRLESYFYCRKIMYRLQFLLIWYDDCGNSEHGSAILERLSESCKPDECGDVFSWEAEQSSPWTWPQVTSNIGRNYPQGVSLWYSEFVIHAFIGPTSGSVMSEE